MNFRATNLHISPMPGAVAARVEVTSGAAVTLSTSLTASVAPEGTKYVIWQVQTGAMYVTFDGTTPSATNGFSYVAGEDGEWDIATARAATAIAASTTGYLYVQAATD